MEAVAEHRRQTEDPESMKLRQEALRGRKLANTRTSIMFGNAPVVYESDAHGSQTNVMKGYDAEERVAQSKRNRLMKQQLTRANFSLGDEKVEYSSVLHDGLRSTIEAKGGGRQEMCQPARGSSIQFGSENKVDYKSTAQEAMVYHGSAHDFAASKKNVSDLKNHLRRHQISLGEEKVEYLTDSQKMYAPIDPEKYDHKNRKAELRKVINDCQACHFSLGEDKPEYVSNSHLAQRVNTGMSLSEIQQEMANAKRMKQQLQRTSFEVGSDPEYM